MTEQATPQPKLVRWLIGLPVGLFALLMLGSAVLFHFSPDKETQWVERETIRTCWKEMQRAPDSDKPRHFKAGDCEQLEADFKNRWKINP